MAIDDANRTTVVRLFGGPDPGHRSTRPGILGACLLPFSPLFVLARFGGFDLSPAIQFILDLLIWGTASVPIVAYLNSIRRHPSKWRFVQDWKGSTIFLGAFLLASFFALLKSGWVGAEAVAAIGILFLALHRGALLLLGSKKFQGRPALALGASFSLMILLGSLFLSVAPNATQGDQKLSFVDALFTATSATCVTGLETVSTASTLSLFGQSIVLFLIQIGGLGIMTLGTFLLLTSGHRLGLSGRAMVSESLNVDGQNSVARLLGAILGFTFAFEAFGAIGFYFWFSGDTHPIFSSIFHSISAFCNAGFALRSDSFGDFTIDPVFNVIGMVLITAGGLGFTVLRELRSQLRSRLKKRERKPLTLHTRLVLYTSFALVAIGTLGIYLLERHGVLAGMSGPEAFLTAMFQSVSTRTAGFATVPFSGEGGLSQATRFFMMPIMWIGASPGSTGGGLKTITFIVLFLGVVAQMRRRKHAEALGRRIPDDQLRQAATVALLYGCVLCVAVLALLISEGGRFALNELLFEAVSAVATVALLYGCVLCVAVLALLISEGGRFALNELLFEAVSAVATVGFSCGVSGAEGFSDFGKLVVVVLMFVGRLGPLTLVLVLGRSNKRLGINYPEERVMIG